MNNAVKVVSLLPIFILSIITLIAAIILEESSVNQVMLYKKTLNSPTPEEQTDISKNVSP